MEEQQFTIQDAIAATINSLGSISVPVGLIDQIGRPIALAIHNLTVCLDAMKEIQKDGEKE